MKCRCKAKPEPTVTWYRDKEVVNKSKKIAIKTLAIGEDSYELTLEIKVKYNTNDVMYSFFNHLLLCFYLGSRSIRWWHISMQCTK